MEPAKRSFPARAEPTTEAALLTRGFSQLYLSLGDASGDGAIACGSTRSPGAADLARRRRDGARRRALALRPAPARRRADPARRAGAAAGRVRHAKSSLWLALLAGLLVGRPVAFAVQPDEVLPDPGARSARPAICPPAALPRLPEPVHRRLRRAARPRPAPPRARAAYGGRQQDSAGARLPASRYGEFVLLRPRLGPGDRTAVALPGGPGWRRGLHSLPRPSGESGRIRSGSRAHGGRGDAHRRAGRHRDSSGEERRS